MWPETSRHKAVIVWLQRGVSLTGFERDPQAALCREQTGGVGITKPRVESKDSWARMVGTLNLTCVCIHVCCFSAHNKEVITLDSHQYMCDE